MSNEADKSKLFRKILAGEVGALIDFVDGERLSLYDYLLRMTGQVNRSIDCIDDAIQGLHEDAIATLQSASQLRILLYITARRLVSDIWNADTHSLNNASLDLLSTNNSNDETATRQTLSFRALDKAFRNLSGGEREAVTLRHRCGFDFAEISEIMECPADVSEQLYLSGMQRIDAECSGIVIGPEASIERMPGHPLPERTSQATINLSMVMEGIKTKPVGLRSPKRIAVLVACGLLLLVYIVYPDVFTRLFAMVTSASN